MGHLAHLPLDFTSTSELLFASFSDRVLLQNVSHENNLIFMRINEQMAHLLLHEGSCPRGKSQLGTGLFIHELA